MADSGLGVTHVSRRFGRYTDARRAVSQLSERTYKHAISNFYEHVQQLFPLNATKEEIHQRATS